MYSGYRSMSPFSRAGSTISRAPMFSLVSTLKPAASRHWAYISATIACSVKSVEPTVMSPSPPKLSQVWLAAGRRRPPSWWSPRS